MKLRAADADTSAQNAALQMLIDAHDVPMRPCSHCQRTCPNCNRTDCTCLCSIKCTQAPNLLSEEPDRYPIEPSMVPLVYALAQSGVFQPFWSCEGHADPNGEIYRLPQVWFYAASQVHIQLLIEKIASLCSQKLVAIDWRINLTYSQDEFLPAYSLAPQVTEDSSHNLSEMQQELAIIAEHVRDLSQLAKEKADKHN